ncbi:SurA N-terminal domain-containing protein [Buchnera aphidicola]|uniref:SurA N-terminal domain-containing protein n=1 Tax=Buchnera aphidicola TaxID=9 RepID=UPI003464CECD
MIKYFKSQLSLIIVKFILGIIILSLIFGTINSYINSDPKKYIAKVNEEEISIEMLKKMYFNTREKQKKILGKNFLEIKDNKEIQENTYNYALNQLINNTLLEQYVKKINFNINDDEIKKVILNNSKFQKNNTFDKKKYLSYLSKKNLTHYEYINLIKKKISTTKFIHSIAQTDFILDNEKKQIIKLLSQKRIIKKAILKIDPIISIQKVKISEIYDYFYKNKNKFYIPEKLKISYIRLKPDLKKIKYNDTEIKNWYKKNIKKYLIEEKRQYSIIQTKNKSEGLLILSELQRGGNFSKIATEKSIDPISSKRGGNIGWIKINLIPNEIKLAHLEKVNQISKIIKFNNSFLIIKLNKIIPKKYRKISEVSDSIKNEIKNEKALKIYKKLHNKLAILAKKHVNRFDLILKESKIIPCETNWFDKNSIPTELQNPVLKKIIFEKGILDRKNKLKKHSGLIFLKNNESFILSVKNFQEKKYKNFKDVKIFIINAIKYMKAKEAIKNKAKKILFQLNIGNQNILKKENIYFEKYESISRYDENLNASKIFSMPYPDKGKNIYTIYQDKNQDFVIASLYKIYYEKFSKEEEKIIIKYLEKNNVDIVFQCLLNNLRKNSTIKLNKIENI